MHQVPSAPDRVVLFGDFDAFTQEQIYDYFTTPELLVKWWPVTAIADPKVGGSYCFQWPDQGWNLKGEYLAAERGKVLEFTWQWDHEPVPQPGPHRVEIWMECIHEKGVRIGIYHKGFEDTADSQASRQGVAEGWIHFGMRLAGLKTGDVD